MGFQFAENSSYTASLFGCCGAGDAVLPGDGGKVSAGDDGGQNIRAQFERVAEIRRRSRIGEPLDQVVVFHKF